jgi:hypothetical protein
MPRKDLGHTETVLLKMHPALKTHVEQAAGREYCTVAEYLRRLVIADMRKERA